MGLGGLEPGSTSSGSTGELCALVLPWLASGGQSEVQAVIFHIEECVKIYSYSLLKVSAQEVLRILVMPLLCILVE